MQEGRTLKAALDEGVLLDMSHVATRIGILCPTFVTKVFWESLEISRSEERLAAVLDLSCDIHELVGDGKTGLRRFGVGTSPSILPWGVGLTALVERFEGFGLVVVVGDFEEDLDFRAERAPSGGSFYTM